VVTGADLTTSVVAPADGGVSPSQDFTVSMSNAATDACQGATFTLTLRASGLSS
jgi:hypothetical protein